MAPRPVTGRDHERGFSMTELLTVLAIFGIFMAVASPNATGLYDTFVLRSSARGVATMLKLGRMKAVSYNRRYTAEYDPSAADVVRGAGDCHTSRHIVAVYRTGIAKPTLADECFRIHGKITTTALPNATNRAVQFEPSGQAKTTAPNWFLLRTNTRCQLVCVSTGGEVQMNPVRTGSGCTAPNYGATTETPCPPPA